MDMQQLHGRVAHQGCLSGRKDYTLSRAASLILLILTLLPGAAFAPVNRDEVRLWAVHQFWGIDEAFLRAGRRLENGPVGYEYGARPEIFRAAYTNPCLPEGSGQYACFALAHYIALQRFVMQDEYMRRKYFHFFAEYWHRGSSEANRSYAAMLQTIWKDERVKLKARARAGGYDPFTVEVFSSATVYGRVKP